MHDPLFGSHYIEDACDLAVLAEAQVKPQKGVIPNKVEAKRLYTAALESLALGIEELKTQTPVNIQILAQANGRAEIWKMNMAQIDTR